MSKLQPIYLLHHRELIYLLHHYTSNIVLCDNLEWDGVGGGREAKEGGDIHTPMANSC